MDDDRRWGIWVDVEGFGNLWSSGSLALTGLRELTRIIYAIGSKCYPKEPDRLFAHQMGDAFYIASDFHEPSLGRCVAIATVLMRCVTNSGCVARASIAEGAIADYSGCRPKEVMFAGERSGDHDILGMGSGIMTLQAVMGQGLINAVVLDKMTQTKGALLCIAKSSEDRLPTDFIRSNLDEASDILAIDWIHSDSALVDEIAVASGLTMPTTRELEERLTQYIAHHDLKRSWSEPTLRFAGM